MSLLFFFFNDAGPPEFSPFPLPAAFPIFACRRATATPSAARRLGERRHHDDARASWVGSAIAADAPRRWRSRPNSRGRSEEHTSELQSRSDIVCRLLLEKKTTAHTTTATV